jgi:Putative zinc-finger
MRCGRAQRMMAAALDGALGSRQRDALGRHLAACAPCGEEMARSERLHAALAAVPTEVPVPPGLADATLRRIRAVAADEEKRRGRWWLQLGLPALGLVAAAALAVVLLDADLPRVERLASAPVVSAPAPAPPPAQVASAPRPAPAPAARAATAPEEPATETVVPNDPPPELAARPDLFIDLRLLRNLEKIEHFDAILTTHEGSGTGDGGRQG